MTRYQQRTVILLAMALKKSKGVYNEGDDIKIICSYTRVRKIIANNNGFDTSRKKMFYDGLDEFKTKTFLDVLILKDYKYNPDISTLEFVITSEAYNKIFSHIINYDIVFKLYELYKNNKKRCKKLLSIINKLYIDGSGKTTLYEYSKL